MKKTTNKKQHQSALSIVRMYFPGVEKVSDADKSIDIEVTEKDNRDSTPLDHAVCAFAVACKRTLKADGVLVGIKTAYVIFGKQALRYRLLESTSREIVSFDRHAGFVSGRYALRAPEPYAQLGYERTGRTRNTSGRKRGPMHVTKNVRTILGRGEPKGAEL